MPDHIEYESSDGEFLLFEDGNWAALQDGRVVHSGCFSHADIANLPEHLMRIEQGKVGMYDDDRIEPH